MSGISSCVRLFAASLTMAAFAHTTHAAQDALLPLLATDIPHTCGCSFTRYKSKNEAPILRWVSDGKKQAFLRSGDKSQVLELRQEKHIPERTGAPQLNDRMVLFVANGEWQVQVLGAVMSGACSAKHISSCTDTRYEGRLLVQQNGGARTEIPVDGNCGCPK